MKHSDYLKKKKTRETRKKIISIISAIVVFITTYALVLPAITLDVSKASQEPGIAYEQMQFKATAAAASVTAADSTVEEAQVEEPAAEEPEEEPAEEIKEEEPAETPEEETSAVSAEEEEEEEAVEEAPAEPEQEEAPAEPEQEEEAPEVRGDKSEADSADEKSSGSAPAEAEAADAQKTEEPAVDQTGTDAAEAAAAATTEEVAPEFKIPELDALDFDDILTGKTNFYYYHVEDAEEAEEISSDSIDDWKKVNSDTVLAPEDFVRVYLSYEIPAGALNETNAVARYKLPTGLELSDKQIKAINKYENGIAASMSGSDQDKYLGAEAIEGSRTPDEKVDDEYISATVKVKKTDNDRQELVFTFIPYTVEKNQVSYDDKGEVKSKGKEVKGFFSFDLKTSQIGFDNTNIETVEKEDGTTEEIQYSQAKVVFADKDSNWIERALTLAAPIEKEEAQEPKTLTSEGSDYTVTVTYTDDAQIPDNAELTVREIEKDTEEYASYLEQAQNAVDFTKSVSEARFFDITILVDGEKVEPQAPVGVQITFAGIEQTNTDDTQLLHYKDSEEVEVMDKAEFSKSEEQAVDTVQFEADGFSVYGIVGTETITTHVITAEGETYEISVTYGQDADIPVDASLNAVEILEGTDAYNQYLSASAEQLMVADEDVHFARFFDVQIKKDEQIIEPKAPVEVKITYSAGISIEDGNELSVVHFAEDGIEIISDLGINDDNTEITYQQDSFSVIGTVTTTPTEGWPDNGDYIMVVTSNNTPGRYYAVSYTGRLMEVEYNPTTREVTFPYFLRTDQLNGYTWSISGNTGRQRQVSSNGWYLDPRAPGNNNTNWSRVGTYYSRVPLNTTARSVSRTDNGTLQGVNNNGNTNGYYLTVSPEGSSAAATLNLQIAASNSSSAASRATVYFASKSSFKVDEEEIPDPDHPQPEPDLDDIGDAPGHQKKLIDNENGTYTLSLDVQGKADSGKGGGGANVIIVYDYSGSMDQTMAGGNRRRIEVARDVVKQLADDLIPDPATSSDKIWFNLVPFSNTAQTPGQWTNNKTSFLQRVNSYDPSQYTDWTGAMRRTANMSVPDNGFPTYVIFVTDGQPSGYSDSENTRHEQSGSYHSAAGTSDVTDPCYYNAIPGAQQLVEKGYYLYGVFIGSDDTNMVANLIHDAGEDPDEYSYKASTVSAFEEVFAKISAEIKASISFDDVAIIDTMTDATSSTVIAAGSTAEDYSYFITKNGTGYEIVLNDDGNISNIYNATIGSNGKATRGTSAGNAVTIEDDKGNSLELVVGNPFPKAGSSGDTVTWDIGELGVLLNDYSYTVQFVVWPNQDAYDTVAGLNNGTIQWSQVDQTQYTRNTTTTPTSYGLRTNIEEESMVTFKKTKITQTGDDDPVIEEETGSSKYTPPTPVPLVNHKISVEKTFEDTLYGTDVPSTMQVVVNRDTVEFATIDLTKDGNVWKGELFIAPGLKVDGEILDTGYDYSVVKEIVKDARGEDISYRYELISGTFHPMLIDSATVITDETGQTGTLKAENHARGYLELKKEIQDITDTTTEFTLDITQFVDKDGNAYSDEVMSDIWGVIYTGDDPYASGSSATWHPLTYWFDSGKNAYSVVLKQGETFRIGSVPVGTQYTVTETDVPSTYELVGFREDTVESGTTSKGQLNEASSISGSVDKANKGYIAVCVNKLAERGVKIRKTDNADTPAPLKDAVFSMVIDNITYVLTSNDEGYLEFTGKIVDGEETALDQNDPSGVLTSLKVGNYVLNETNPPAGYVALDGRVAISVGQTVTADIAEVKAYDAEDQEITDTETPVAYYVVFVTNAPGKPLPHTGGSGTFLYTLSGVALILASALMYGFRMRRRERRLN